MGGLGHHREDGATQDIRLNPAGHPRKGRVEIDDRRVDGLRARPGLEDHDHIVQPADRQVQQSQTLALLDFPRHVLDHAGQQLAVRRV